MRTLLISLLFVAAAAPAYAQPKAGQYTGVRPCKATAGSISVDATSKDTYGVSHCKSAIQKALVEKHNACVGKKKNEKVTFDWQFGKDGDKDKATGSYYVVCKG